MTSSEIAINHPILSVVSPIICLNRQHFLDYFTKVCQSGEGIILRKPTSWYFEKDSFFSKKPFEEKTVMRLENRQYKWYKEFFLFTRDLGQQGKYIPYLVAIPLMIPLLK